MNKIYSAEEDVESEGAEDELKEKSTGINIKVQISTNTTAFDSSAN